MRNGLCNVTFNSFPSKSGVFEFERPENPYDLEEMESMLLIAKLMQPFGGSEGGVRGL